MPGSCKVIRWRGPRVATPYLRRWFTPVKSSLPGLDASTNARLTAVPKHLIPFVVDLGCGDGRNSAYLQSLGFRVSSYDMEPDFAGGLPWMAGRDPIPEDDNTCSLVLCQFLLMFLSDQEIYNLCLEIERVTKPGGYVIVELQKVKSGRDVKLSTVIDFFLKKDHLTRRQAVNRGVWRVFHKARNRCVLKYVHHPLLPSQIRF